MSQETITQATVSTWGTTPTATRVPRPAVPDSSSPLVQVRLLASGLHTLVRLRATGTHYSASALPHIPGTDGVGVTVPDNQLVYFSAMMLPNGGSFVEYVNVPRAAITAIPDGGNPVQVAGLVNPAAASWMALATRVDLSALPVDETGKKSFSVLILGVTALSGTVAISVSRLFGATTIVGVGRSPSKLAALSSEYGLDETIQLSTSPSGEDTTNWTTLAQEPDIILDFLYGPATISLFKALKPNKRIQYVQLGSSASPTIQSFPADLFRSKDLTVRGSGPGAWSMTQYAEEAPKIVAAIAGGGVKEFGGFREAKLKDIEKVWEESGKGGERVVFIP
ncbi:alcohol dehydrogenase superfamily zinc-containing protein [Naviculisporaceae sp. PSN 640]